MILSIRDNRKHKARVYQKPDPASPSPRVSQIRYHFMARRGVSGDRAFIPFRRRVFLARSTKRNGKLLARVLHDERREIDTVGQDRGTKEREEERTSSGLVLRLDPRDTDVQNLLFPDQSNRYLPIRFFLDQTVGNFESSNVHPHLEVLGHLSRVNLKLTNLSKTWQKYSLSLIFYTVEVV